MKGKYCSCPKQVYAYYGKYDVWGEKHYKKNGLPYCERKTITRMIGESWRKRRQYIAFVVLSLVAVGLTAILIPSSNAYFQRFFHRQVG